MLRVAIIGESVEGTALNGGVQSATRYLLDALVDTGRVELHLLHFDYKAKDAVSFANSGFNTHLIPGAKFGAANLYSEDQKRVNKCLEVVRPDIVHSQGAGHYGIVACRCGYPSVMTIHGIMSEEAKHIRDPRKKFRRWLISLVSDRYCIRRATNTIVISPYVNEYYGDKLGGRHFHIPNPVAPAFFELAHEPFPGRVLFAGRIYPLKGVLDLIRAIAPIAGAHNLQLDLAGALHDRSYTLRLQEEIGRLGLREVVNFLGVLPATEFRERLRRSAVLVLPSYQETAPMVIQEAMAGGVPVIATKVGGVPYQIEHGVTGYLVDPGDTLALGTRIDQLLSNQELSSRISQAAREYAMNNYQAESVALKTIDVYEQILAA